MKDDVLGLILHAEGEYSGALKNAVSDAAKYADESRAAHADRMEQLKSDFQLFERSEREMFEEALAEYDAHMSQKLKEAKERLMASQAAMIGKLSERIKNEVLSRYDS